MQNQHCQYAYIFVQAILPPIFRTKHLNHVGSYLMLAAQMPCKKPLIADLKRVVVVKPTDLSLLVVKSAAK